MTVRTAELLMAIFTIVISILLMVKAADNRIGWVVGRGPGAGAWPFWLATVMLLASIATLVRWFQGKTPESRNYEAFLDRDTVSIVGITVAALIALLGLTHFIGLYASLVLFLLFYLKIVGRHHWPAVIMLVGGIPLFVFALFEAGLQIPLPKAWSEEWFYPVYDVMYSNDSISLGFMNFPVFWAYVIVAYVVLAAISYAIHRMTRPAQG